MMARMSRPRIVCLVGPTASGKSALGLALAERLGAEIVSADSRQVYRRLEIGTAKPTAAERARVPHHGLDLVEPHERFDVARFRGMAAGAIVAAAARGRPVLVVGGTGLYVRALLRGLCGAPPRVPALRRVLEAKASTEGPPALHRWLRALDPRAAARIHAHDAIRIVRAVEVALATGVPLSRWQAGHAFGEGPYDALIVGLARPTPELDARIVARARAMLAAGLLDEVRGLLAAGVPEDAPGLAAVGYREMAACAAGRLDVEAALAAMVLATRRFAKRQRTWFRHEPAIHWRHPERDATRVEREATAFLATGGRPDAS
jgi:tRNA dimethylallyltransferase